MFKTIVASAATVAATDMMYNIEGAKGFYQGAYSGLYRSNTASMDQCLDETTADNFVYLWGAFTTPSMWMSEVMSVKTDFTMFDAYAEVMEDIAECHFEAFFIDLQDFCADEANDCSFSNIMANMQKNMFPLVGKVTEIGQSLEDFPSPDADMYKMQMKTIGDGVGSSLRLVLDYRQ